MPIENLLRNQATQLLKQALENPSASFKSGQLEAIEAVVRHNHRTLVVQPTGWGKSMVYFIATKLLRERGSGTALMISPLIALMRDQVRAAKNVGLTARFINYEIEDEARQDTISLIIEGQLDLLLISPEQLKKDYLRKLEFSFLIIDEAHCISDWGHDFRPDYRRIKNIVSNLPPSAGILATTATATEAVVDDVAKQIGAPYTLRGLAKRDNLRLACLRLKGPMERAVWLARVIQRYVAEGKVGIVYALTKRKVDDLTDWLQSLGMMRKPITAEKAPPADIESRLRRNELDVVVATNALGMGMDKPDLDYVIHSQRPKSIVHYYQEVGRAGRGIPIADAIMLDANDDQEINEYFIEGSFPDLNEVEQVLSLLGRSDGLSEYQLRTRVNISKQRLNGLLKYLWVEDPPPITCIDKKWSRTLHTYQPNTAHINRLAEQRQGEWERLKAYFHSDSCRMQFVSEELGQRNAEPCGHCDNCDHPSWIPAVEIDTQMLDQAKNFFKRMNYFFIPRKKWAEVRSRANPRGYRRRPSSSNRKSALRLYGRAMAPSSGCRKTDRYL